MSTKARKKSERARPEIVQITGISAKVPILFALDTDGNVWQLRHPASDSFDWVQVKAEFYKDKE
jgi:hypothetical protein